MKYGYARKSSVQQSLSIQVAALKEAGCDIVRQEQGSGTTRNGRIRTRNTPRVFA